MREMLSRQLNKTFLVINGAKIFITFTYHLTQVVDYNTVIILINKKESKETKKK